MQPDHVTDRSGTLPAGSTAIATQPPPTFAPPAAPPTDADGYRTSPDQDTTGWPPGVPYIVGNEACERFSFYGMRAILYVHLTSLYAASAVADAAASATAAYHLFVAAVYATPMIGALVADRWAGKYRTIFYLSLVYCLGHAVLSGGENYLVGMFFGLGLIAVGSGGIKPCVSANVGDQFGKSNWGKVRTVYQIFYFSINFGSFFATLLIPVLKDSAGFWLVRWLPAVFGSFDPVRLGVSVAFGVPGVLMLLATLIFWMGRRKFVHVPPNPGGCLGLLDTACAVALFLTFGHLLVTPDLLQTPFFDENKGLKYGVMAAASLAFLVAGLGLFVLRQRLRPDDGFLAVVLHVVRSHLGLADGSRAPAVPDAPAISHADSSLARSGFWRPALDRFGLKPTEGPVAVFKVISVFFLLTIFWALFDQHGSTWVRQAGQMNLAGFKASQIQAANPLLVMMLIPVMNLLYALSDRIGLKTTPLRRITVGMWLTASSFVACALLQQAIDKAEANSIHVGWQLIQYLLVTVGEVMVSITGLEFAYTQAPKRMKSTVMGFFLLTVTMGNVLVALLAKVQKPMTEWVSANVIKGVGETATFFWVFAVLSAVAALIFGVRAYFYVPKDFAQE